MDYKLLVEQMEELMGDGYWSESIAILDEHPELATFVNAEDYGRTLLHSAACYDGAPELVDALVKLGANVSLEDTTGATPLGNAIHSGYRLGLDTDRNIEILVAAGADLSGFDETGNPPLHAAIYERRPKTVSFLLEKGADPFQKNSYGDDAFEWMTWLKDTSMKDILDRYVK